MDFQVVAVEPEASPVLSGGQPGIVIIGHQAVNRMSLSLFLYRRTEDVPYTYVPQDQYFRIVATYRQKLVEMLRFSSPLPLAKGEEA